MKNVVSKTEQIMKIINGKFIKYKVIKNDQYRLPPNRGNE